VLELGVKGFLLSLSLCLDLGIVNVALIHTALRQGSRPAFALGLGSALGDLLYAFVSIAAISLLLEHRAVRLALWVGGTVALIWLTVRMLREATRPRSLEEADTSATPAAAASFSRGLVLALASPSAILWFAAVGGSVIAAHADDARALAPFMIGFAVAGVAWSALIALSIGRARHVAGPGVLRAAAVGSALLFAYFAVDVFVRGYREFVV
jgi:L-lysine exporter family protein LysE/ArgO